MLLQFIDVSMHENSNGFAKKRKFRLNLALVLICNVTKLHAS